MRSWCTTHIQSLVCFIPLGWASNIDAIKQPAMPTPLLQCPTTILTSLFLHSISVSSSNHSPPSALFCCFQSDLFPCILRHPLSTIRQRSKDPHGWISQAQFSDSLSPHPTASNFSDLPRSEKDLLGSSLNRGEWLVKCLLITLLCALSLSLTLSSNHTNKPSKLTDTKLYRSSLQHALFLDQTGTIVNNSCL